MPQAFKYPVKPLLLSDYIIASDTSEDNVTRNFSVSGIVDAIRGSLGIATVTSISTANSRFIDLTSTPSPITSVGDITAVLSATDLPAVAVRSLYFLRGDGKWILPGPEPTEITGFNEGVVLTTNLNSINFVGNVQVIGDTTGFLELNFPGTAALVDSINAGSGIGVVTTAGNAVISNTGALQVVAGGNVTVSGGTGTVTVSSAKNPGTVTAINSGLGIAPITNNTSNPRINIQYTSISNYIADNLTNTVISLNDTVNYNQIGPSNVKSTRLRNIPHDALALIKTYIDNNDSSKIKNDTDVGYDTTATVDQIVTLAIAEYQALAVKDPSTLYLIVGPGASFTQNLVISSVSGIINSEDGLPASSGQYALSPLPQSVTGVVGTPFSFNLNIAPTQQGATITNKSGFGPITGAIASGGGTTNMTLVATITQALPNTGRIQLNIDTTKSLGINNNLAAFPNVWQLTMPTGQGSLPSNAFFPYDQTPPQFLTATNTNTNLLSYAFGPNIEITNSAYEIVNITYRQQENGADFGYFTTWCAGSELLTTVDETIPVTHYISAEIQLKGGAQSVILHDSVDVELADGSAAPKTDNIYITRVNSVLPNPSSTATRPSITGTGNAYGTTVYGGLGANFQWGNPTTTVSSAVINGGTYAFSAADPLTHTFTGDGQTGTIATNGFSTMTTSGTLIFTPTPALVVVGINIKDSIAYPNGTSQADFVLQILNSDGSVFQTVAPWITDPSVSPRPNSGPITLFNGVTTGTTYPLTAVPKVPTMTATANATPIPGFEFTTAFSTAYVGGGASLPTIVPSNGTYQTLEIFGQLDTVLRINPPFSIKLTGSSFKQPVAYLIDIVYPDADGTTNQITNPMIAGGFNLSPSSGHPNSSTVAGFLSSMRVLPIQVPPQPTSTSDAAGRAVITITRQGIIEGNKTQSNFRIVVKLETISTGAIVNLPASPTTGGAGTFVSGYPFATGPSAQVPNNPRILNEDTKLIIEITEE